MVTINLYSTKRYSKKVIVSMFGEAPDRILVHNTAQELYHYFINRTGSWVIECDGVIIGLFSLQYRDNQYYTATYIFPHYRGKGINTPLKRAVLHTSHLCHEKVVSTIRQDNRRSLEATLKAFPQTVTFAFTDVDGELKFLCDYSLQVAEMDAGVDTNIPKVLRKFFVKQSKAFSYLPQTITLESSPTALDYSRRAEHI